MVFRWFSVRKVAASALAATLVALTAEGAAGAQGAADVRRGVGYALISVQPGRTTEEKTLQAIRASHLAALRNLAEQLDGVAIEGRTSVAASSMQADDIHARVSGIVAGARTVKITPKGPDTYETMLEVALPATPAASAP